jgi:hypothetical protein
MSREELTNACRTAAEALQVLGNVNPVGILNRVEGNTNRVVPSSLPNRLSNVFGDASASGSNRVGYKNIFSKIKCSYFLY